MVSNPDAKLLVWSKKRISETTRKALASAFVWRLCVPLIQEPPKSYPCRCTGRIILRLAPKLLEFRLIIADSDASQPRRPEQAASDSTPFPHSTRSFGNGICF